MHQISVERGIPCNNSVSLLQDLQNALEFFFSVDIEIVRHLSRVADEVKLAQSDQLLPIL